MKESGIKFSGEKRKKLVNSSINNQSGFFMLRTGILLVISVFILLTPSWVSAQETETGGNVSELKELDIRVLSLKYYLTYNDSPLKDYAEVLVEAADKQRLDWRLMPAIAGVESNFGKRIPQLKNNRVSSHNAWGWGIYGGKIIRFRSWDQGIDKVAKGLKDKYIAKGLIDSFKMNDKYSSNPDWGWQVAFFINDLQSYTEAFSKKFGEQIETHNNLIRAANTPQSLPLPETKKVVNEHSLSTIDQSTIITTPPKSFLNSDLGITTRTGSL